MLNTIIIYPMFYWAPRTDIKVKNLFQLQSVENGILIKSRFQLIKTIVSIRRY